MKHRRNTAEFLAGYAAARPEIDALRAVNASLVATIERLQGMGLGRNAYTVCAEALAKAKGAE